VRPRARAPWQLIDHLKKSEMAKEAERLLEDTRWLPEPLRLAEVAPPSGVKEALPEFLSDDEGQAGEVGESEPDTGRRCRITHRCGAAHAAPQPSPRPLLSARMRRMAGEAEPGPGRV